MKKEKKIVVIGGTFNPPTLAHLNLAIEAKNCVDADFVIFVPTKSSYMKNWKKYQNSDICPDDIRLRMVMTCECEWLKVDTCEIDGIVSGRTYDTIQYIKEKYHTLEVYFAIGSDKLKEIPRWANSEIFLSTEKFIVMKRNDDDIHAIMENDERLSKHINAFVICEMENVYTNCSSTFIRKCLTSKNKADLEKARQLVSKEVWDILKEDYPCQHEEEI